MMMPPATNTAPVMPPAPVEKAPLLKQNDQRMADGVAHHRGGGGGGGANPSGKWFH